jgi:uncharacterized protein YgbK (DUF1537 family)
MARPRKKPQPRSVTDWQAMFSYLNATQSAHAAAVVILTELRIVDPDIALEHLANALTAWRVQEKP